MTKRTNKKRAFILSFVALMIFCSMLVGTTYAWFTDSVTSANNKIVSGNLDIEMYLWSDATTPVPITDNPDPIFGAGSIAQNNAAETLWEPGKTQVVYLSLKNNGSLALKYRVSIDVRNDTTPHLSDVMEYAITPDATFGQVTEWAGGVEVVEGINVATEDSVPLAAGQEHFFALSVHMDENAGNEYMLGQITFDINVIAGQLASEMDSFGSDYDDLALYPDGSYRVGAMAETVEAAEGSTVTIKNASNTFIATARTGANGKVSATLTEATSSPNVFAIAEANGLGLASYDIKVTGQTEGSDVEVSLYLGEGFTGVTVYHKGRAMGINEYSYDPITGYVSFTTSDFSVFEVTYGDVANVITAFEEIAALREYDGNHVLGADITASNIIHFGSITGSLDLNGKTITAGKPDQYLFGAQGGGTLILNGNGKANCGKGFYANNNGTIVINGGEYNMTVTGTLNNIRHTALAQKNSKIIINGGKFTTDVVDAALFFATSNARIEINGGFFENTADDTPDLLSMGTNKSNTNRIILKGGTFVNYNPLEDRMTYTGEWPEAGEAAFGGPWMLVWDGYTVVAEPQANGDVWYSVVPVADAQ